MDEKVFEVLQPYCSNDMRLLKRISKSIFLRFNESLTEADYDDFYSIANMTLWQACQTYNSNMGISFDVFLRTCLKKKFATEIRDRHRGKRIGNQFTISLDASNENEDECSLLEYIPSDFDTFEEVLKRQSVGQFTEKVQTYISKLSNQQVNMLNLLVDGYKPSEIREILQISEREYSENLQIMKAYENAKILF